MKALIIDDEPQARIALKSQLERNMDNMEVIGEAGGVTEAKQLINELQPEIIFLDIQLSDGTGFDLLEVINYEKINIVFTTAYHEHAIKAFKYNAIDYLLKPIDTDDLIQTIDRLQKKLSSSEHIKKLMSDFKKEKLEQLVIQTSEGYFIFKLSDITHITSDGNYSKFFFTNRKPLLVSKTLKEYEHLLQDDGFLRIHLSYLVNITHIVSFHTNIGLFITLSNQENIPVSHRKKTILLDFLKNL